jgi:hypothetical protein
MDTVSTNEDQIAELKGALNEYIAKAGGKEYVLYKNGHEWRNEPARFEDVPEQDRTKGDLRLDVSRHHYYSGGDDSNLKAFIHTLETECGLQLYEHTVYNRESEISDKYIYIAKDVQPDIPAAIEKIREQTQQKRQSCVEREVDAFVAEQLVNYPDMQEPLAARLGHQAEKLGNRSAAIVYQGRLDDTGAEKGASYGKK